MTIDRWENASAYDRFMGRWSRSLARKFVEWLALPPSASWLEIGCGTGSLTAAICELADPASVLACDTASDFVSYCREHLAYPRLTVQTATLGQVPVQDGGFDAVVSSLVLNFLPTPIDALAQMRASCSPRGCVAACVWDYSEGMEFLRLFWDAAVLLDPAAELLHEGRRFPICRPEALRSTFEAAGLESIRVEAVTVATTFASFEDYWAPFVNGPGPAPTYVSTLSHLAREKLADHLRHALGSKTPLHLHARAWAAQGRRS
jgi:ubiquinone/menaquinone biosynthesis C-methylase UbiE